MQQGMDAPLESTTGFPGTAVHPHSIHLRYPAAVCPLKLLHRAGSHAFPPLARERLFPLSQTLHYPIYRMFHAGDKDLGATEIICSCLTRARFDGAPDKVLPQCISSYHSPPYSYSYHGGGHRSLSFPQDAMYNWLL